MKVQDIFETKLTTHLSEGSAAGKFKNLFSGHISQIQLMIKQALI